ncbi:MAG: hypothetical protein ACO2PM_15160 [Pyrobaculum sp.]|jgi:hypothetical protein
MGGDRPEAKVSMEFQPFLRFWGLCIRLLWVAGAGGVWHGVG